MRKTAGFILALFLFYSMQPVISRVGAADWIGQAIAAGDAQINLNGSGWTKIGEMTYPVGAESALRTGGGSLSISLKNGGRIDLGRNSEISVSPRPGGYMVSLAKGRVVVNNPAKASICVRTPDGLMFRPANGNSSYAVYFDGRPQAASFAGNLEVTAGERILANLPQGRSLVMEGRTARVLPVQAEGAITEEGLSTGAIITGGAIVVGGAVAIIAAKRYRDEKGPQASPFVP